jgi:hypothetical protein
MIAARAILPGMSVTVVVQRNSAGETAQDLYENGTSFKIIEGQGLFVSGGTKVLGAYSPDSWLTVSLNDERKTTKPPLPRGATAASAASQRIR